MSDYAKMDNSLASSQLDIGESSNLAQIAQTYACNFSNQKYVDYVCILSVLAQAAIDSAKRYFDINLSGEIKRIKKDLDIKTHKYPSFWGIIKKSFNKNNINESLSCPMNCLCDLDLNKFRNDNSTLPMDYFFCKHHIKPNYITCKKIESLISDYSLKLFNFNTDVCNEEHLLLRKDFDSLIMSIQQINISNKYTGLFSWLIDRAFVITKGMNNTCSTLQCKTKKNRAILLKVLYDSNAKAFLDCFSGGRYE